MAQPSRSRVEAPQAGADDPRARRRTILTLALPIIGGMVSQNVLNLVDTAMVGTLGDAALAAVGLASFANFMAQAFITGLAAGVQAMAARRLGEGRLGELAVPLNGGLLVAAALAVPLSALLFVLAPSLFPYLIDDPAVVALGVPYLQARLVGMVAVGMNFAFRGYWNGVNQSKLYMRTLLVMHVSNIVFNYLLIYGKFGFPELGATGAGIGTTLATFIGTGTYVLLGVRMARENGFGRGLPDRKTTRTMLRLALPNGVQMLLFAAGFTALNWIIGQVGTRELAAANVLINLTMVALLPGIAFGLTSASLVGQALGRKDARDASRWAWDVVRVASAALAVLALPLLLVPELVLRGFIHDPQTLAVASLPLRLVGATMALDAVGVVLQHALLGAGASRQVMLVSVALQWGLFLPAAYLLGPVLGFGLLAIWIANLGYRLLQALTFTLLWRRGTWAHIEL